MSSVIKCWTGECFFIDAIFIVNGFFKRFYVIIKRGDINTLVSFVDGFISFIINNNSISINGERINDLEYVFKKEKKL